MPGPLLIYQWLSKSDSHTNQSPCILIKSSKPAVFVCTLFWSHSGVQYRTRPELQKYYAVAIETSDTQSVGLKTQECSSQLI